MMTVRDMVSLETPPKKAAAPIRAKAPGSSQAQYSELVSVMFPMIYTARKPSSRPTRAPISLDYIRDYYYKKMM